MPWQCRACGHLAYRSEVISARDRLLWRARKIRVRVGGLGFDDVFGDFPPRPARMRYATYARLRREAEAAIDEYMATKRTAG